MSATKAKPRDNEQYVTVKCDCGAKGGAYLRHYEFVRCVCGVRYWALRPLASGPLKAFVWPGFPGMNLQQPQQQREAA